MPKVTGRKVQLSHHRIYNENYKCLTVQQKLTTQLFKASDHFHKQYN